MVKIELEHHSNLITEDVVYWALVNFLGQDIVNMSVCQVKTHWANETTELVDGRD